MLLEFPSTTSALRCAVEIQREMGVRNLYVAADDRIELRIGINLGDIIIENISKPIRVYRVALGKGATRTAQPVPDPSSTTQGRGPTRRRIAIAAAAVALVAIAGFAAWQWPLRSSTPIKTSTVGPPSRSIVVLLPFGASASERDLVTIAESLGSDVTSALANSVRDATITPYVVRDKGAPVNPSGLGHQLNGRYLLAGDVRAAGDDIAVTLRLTDTTTAKELGSERRTIARARAADDRDLLVAPVADRGVGRPLRYARIGVRAGFPQSAQRSGAAGNG